MLERYFSTKESRNVAIAEFTKDSLVSDIKVRDYINQQLYVVEFNMGSPMIKYKEFDKKYIFIWTVYPLSPLHIEFIHQVKEHFENNVIVEKRILMVSDEINFIFESKESAIFFKLFFLPDFDKNK